MGDGGRLCRQLSSPRRSVTHKSASTNILSDHFSSTVIQLTALVKNDKAKHFLLSGAFHSTTENRLAVVVNRVQESGSRKQPEKKTVHVWSSGALLLAPRGVSMLVLCTVFCKVKTKLFENRIPNIRCLM